MSFRCLMMLERVKDLVIFAEGDDHNLIINGNFVTSVETTIKRDYHKYDKTS